MRYDLNRRLKKLEQEIKPARTMTRAERATYVVEFKHDMDQRGTRNPEPFDWNKWYKKMRQMIIERGEDPDRPYY